MSATPLLETYLCLEIRLPHLFMFLAQNRKRAAPLCLKKSQRIMTGCHWGVREIVREISLPNPVPLQWVSASWECILHSGSRLGQPSGWSPLYHQSCEQCLLWGTRITWAKILLLGRELSSGDKTIASVALLLGK